MEGNPFYDHFKYLIVSGYGGLGTRDDDIGDLYRGVLYQRGYGLQGNSYELVDMYSKQGLGFGDVLRPLFSFFAPLAKQGLQYLGKQAISTVADIAKDALEGKDVKKAAEERLQSKAETILAKAPQVIKAVTYNQGKKRKVPSLSVSTKPGGSKRKQRKVVEGSGLHNIYPALSRIG